MILQLNLNRHLYIPIRIVGNWIAVFVEVEKQRWLPIKMPSSAGVQHNVLGLIDARLCVRAEWLASDGDRHRVRFPDGQTAWIVSENPAWDEEQKESA